MKIVREKISLDDLEKMIEWSFVPFVKTVVDIQKNIMAVGGRRYEKLESLLIESGSQQTDLWRVHICPKRFGKKEWVKFDDDINLHLLFENKGRSASDPKILEAVINVVDGLVKK